MNCCDVATFFLELKPKADISELSWGWFQKLVWQKVHAVVPTHTSLEGVPAPWNPERTQD